MNKWRVTFVVWMDGSEGKRTDKRRVMEFTEQVARDQAIKRFLERYSKLTCYYFIEELK